MTWLRTLLLALLSLAAVVVSVAYGTALRANRAVGFQVTRASDAAGRSFPVAVWYPTHARSFPTTQLGNVLMNVARDAAVAGHLLPLVVISHGNGGSLASHADLAMALAGAGYVVAAPMHVGDNFREQSRAGRATLFHERAEQLHATITALLTQWSGHAAIDSTRVGAFGYSAGGFTVLTLAGAQPALRRVATHCARTSEFVCDVLRANSSPLVSGADLTALPSFPRDTRVRAAVLAAPGLGFTLDSAALASVAVPVQLWSGERDESVPFATNAKTIRDALGARVASHRVPLAGHAAFLVPCTLLRPSALCTDPDGFDRRAFHAAMNGAVIRFFDERLGR